MSKWFPHVDDQEGINEALKAGFYGAVAFAVMICLGMAFLVFAGHLPGETNDGTIVSGLVGTLIELAIAVTAAWRFKTGKGLVWGSVVFVMFLVEIGLKVANGTTNIGWLFAYAAIGAALINGLRGAWAQRTISSEYSEAVE